jgi:CBS domain-containing protein
MTISDILRDKGTFVVTIAPDLTVLDAMRVLVRHRIGAAVVMAGDDILGILTERDVLRLGTEDPHHATQTRVGDVMTSDLVVGVPDDSIDYVMEIMTRNRIRHLPIIDGGRLAGIVSIGDVVNACRSSVEAENRYLREYIQGVVG